MQFLPNQTPVRENLHLVTYPERWVFNRFLAPTSQKKGGAKPESIGIQFHMIKPELKLLQTTNSNPSELALNQAS
ncbi:MAG: hypothetical protein PVG70_13125 [Desulfobacterales bacterium]